MRPNSTFFPLFAIFLFPTLLLQGQNPALEAFFQDADTFFERHVAPNGLVDYGAVSSDPTFPSLIRQVGQPFPKDWTSLERKAFLVNAYNLLVIDGVLKAYPIGSVQDVAGFFDRKRHSVNGKSVTLNELEKDYLLDVYQDARLHFVLVCGAIGCPPLVPFAYRPESLDQQFDQQTRLALNRADFLKIDPIEQSVSLSALFQWYASDFGQSTANKLNFINTYREQPIPEGYRVSYYDYDWSLNGTMADISGNIQSNNAARYVVSSTIPKGSIEAKIFNNLYTQRTRNSNGDFDERATFFTTIASFLYGASHRLNIGFDLRYRMVRYGAESDSPFRAFTDPTRLGVTTIGPKIRYAPVPKWTNFSIQSAFWFPIGNDLAGRSGDQRFIDWDGPTWWTQVFNDFSLGSKFSLFTELDFLLEDIGSRDNGRINRFSTPVILIFSYFPNPKTTLYTLANYSPFWQEDYDYFYQLGLGAKYQFNPNLELEASYTYFTNEFLIQNRGRAATYNLGIRFNL